MNKKIIVGICLLVLLVGCVDVSVMVVDYDGSIKEAADACHEFCNLDNPLPIKFKSTISECDDDECQCKCE